MKLRSRRQKTPAALLRKLYRSTYARLGLVLFLFLQLPAPRPTSAMSPAPNKITAGGKGTAVSEVKLPRTLATPFPFSKTIRKRSEAKLLRLGAVVGNVSSPKTDPLGSFSVIRK